MIIRTANAADYGTILQAAEDWELKEADGGYIQPFFVHQFRETVFIAEETGRVVGFLLGLVSQSDPDAGYVHLVACDPACRQQGVASALYGAFAAKVTQMGCCRLVAVVHPENEDAMCFHQRLGFRRLRGPSAPETRDRPDVVKDYAGPGQHRVVLVKDLEES